MIGTLKVGCNVFLLYFVVTINKHRRMQSDNTDLTICSLSDKVKSKVHRKSQYHMRLEYEVQGLLSAHFLINTFVLYTCISVFHSLFHKLE